MSFAWVPRPGYGLDCLVCDCLICDCLVCAMFARIGGGLVRGGSQQLAHTEAPPPQGPEPQLHDQDCTSKCLGPTPRITPCSCAVPSPVQRCIPSHTRILGDIELWVGVPRASLALAAPLLDNPESINRKVGYAGLVGSQQSTVT